MKTIVAERLEHKAFEPYGRAIMAGDSAPDIQNDQIDYWDDMADISSLAGQGSIGFMRVKKMPIKLGMLQMLHESAELYITLDGNPSVVFAALSGADDKPDLSTLKAFKMDGGQSVVVDKKVWHCTPFTLADKTDFALLLKNDIIIKNEDGSFGVDLNTIVYEELAEPFTIE